MIYPDIPRLAISVQQPWCGWLALGIKTIENRDWQRSYRGPVALHAGKKADKESFEYVGMGLHPASGNFLPDDHPLVSRTDWHGVCSQTGCIIGVADIVDCVDRSDDEWFVGRYGFVLANARTVPFISVSGALGFFDWRKMLEKAESKRMTA